MSKNRISGPYKSPPFSNFKSCPLALRQKPNGKYRLLHNLSYPYDDKSVNLNILDKNSKVEFSSIYNALDIVKDSRGRYLAKADITDAFRLIPIHHTDYHLLGFCFKQSFYYDKCLPMGCSSACKILKVSDSLVFIMKNHFGIRKVIKYLDDFLFIADTHMECLKALQSFEQMCGMLNIPIAAHKTVHPCTELTFLGYQIDSVRMLVSIPKEKIDSSSVDIRKLMETSSTTLREIKSLIGKLQFVVNVITAGRCFIRRLINLTVGKRHPAQRIIIDETIYVVEFFQKLQWEKSHSA